MTLLVPGGNDFYAVKKSRRGSVGVAVCFRRGWPGGPLWRGGLSTAVAAVGTQRWHPGRRHSRGGGQRCVRAAIGAVGSVQFSHSVVSDSLQPHEPQHDRSPSPSPTPGVYPNPCPLNR